MRYRFGFLLFLYIPAQAIEPVLPSMVLTAVENGVESQDNFTCYGKIHGYIRLADRESRAHALETRWVSPHGRTVADSHSTVEFQTPGSTAYVWFTFPEATSFLAGPDPTLDAERLSFNGLWHVEVRWDDAPL
jgi:hypothetical protein